MKNYVIILLIIFSTGFWSCSDKKKNPQTVNTDELPYDPPSQIPLDPFEQNLLLRRSVNLSTMEADNEGDWGITLTEEHFQLIKDIGFDAIRLPVKWSTHMTSTAPYKIDESYLKRVAWAAQQALNRDLAIILNSHHFDGIYADPDAYHDQFIASWEIIAEYFKDYPDQVFFEILNEPNDQLTAFKWNELFTEVISIIRKTNPGRTIIIGPINWNGYDSLPGLIIPEEERNVIVTFHYYLPFAFTHQGANWVENSNQWLGTKWISSMSERKMITDHFDKVVEWSETNNRPILLGEFGAYSTGDMLSRTLWTRFIARTAEQKNISWAYWEFYGGFGIYNNTTQVWNANLVFALLEKKIE